MSKMLPALQSSGNLEFHEGVAENLHSTGLGTSAPIGIQYRCAEQMAVLWMESPNPGYSGLL